MPVRPRSKRTAGLVAAAVALGPALALAGISGANAVGSASPAPAIKITQSASDAVTPLNSVACGNATNTAENHYYRRFDLNGFYNAAQGFKVTQVAFGVEEASVTAAGDTVPGHVVVNAIDHADSFVLANLEPLATVPVDLSSGDDGAVLTVPISATVPAGKDMVLEVEVDASTTGRLFFIGSNTANETGSSFLSAPACALTEPASTADIGFPDMHVVLFANGKATDCVNAESAVDAARAAATTATAAKAAADAKVAPAKAKDAKAKKAVKKAKKALKKAKKSGDAKKIAKAKKKLKKASKKAKAAKKALAAANAAATAAANALTAANAAVTSTTATATTECAQPALPTRPAGPTAGGGSVKAHSDGSASLHTAR